MPSGLVTRHLYRGRRCIAHGIIRDRQDGNQPQYGCVGKRCIDGLSIPTNLRVVTQPIRPVLWRPRDRPGNTTRGNDLIAPGESGQALRRRGAPNTTSAKPRRARVDGSGITRASLSALTHTCQLDSSGCWLPLFTQSISQVPVQVALAVSNRSLKTKKPEKPPACIENRRSTPPDPVQPRPHVPLCELPPEKLNPVKVRPGKAPGFMMFPSLPICVQLPPGANAPSVGIKPEFPPPIPLLPEAISHWVELMLCRVTSEVILVLTLTPVHGVASAGLHQNNPFSAAMPNEAKRVLIFMVGLPFPFEQLVDHARATPRKRPTTGLRKIVASSHMLLFISILPTAY